ncbi:TetR/AcrR family transcriptional regulator [Streptosporangium lutulentum]
MQSGTRTFIEEARRSQIVACAIEVIATLGYANASLSRIAKLAKVSTGVISYHFGGKDELIQAVVAEVAGIATELMTPRIVSQATAADALRVYIEANLEFMRLHPAAARARGDRHSQPCERRRPGPLRRPARDRDRGPGEGAGLGAADG